MKIPILITALSLAGCAVQPIPSTPEQKRMNAKVIEGLKNREYEYVPSVEPVKVEAEIDYDQFYRKQREYGLLYGRYSRGDYHGRW